MDRDTRACLLTIRVRVDNMLQHDPHLLVPVSEVGGPGAVARGGLVTRAGGRVAAARARRRVGRVRAGVAVPVGRPGELVMIISYVLVCSYIVVSLGHHSPCHRVHHVKDRQPEEQLQQHCAENSEYIGNNFARFLHKYLQSRYVSGVAVCNCATFT